jgi:hypothetical protein
VIELLVHLTRMRLTQPADEVEHGVRPLPLRRCPPGADGARVHERVDLRRHEPVVDEEVFLDLEPGVASFETASPISGQALTKNEVLRPGRRLNRIGLHESEGVERVLEIARDKEASADGVSPKLQHAQHEGPTPPASIVTETQRSQRTIPARRRALRGTVADAHEYS